jgi:hypothetical protein
MAFTQKRIDVTVEMGTGNFGEAGANTVTLRGHRVAAQLQVAGGNSMGRLDLRVWGLTPSLLNQLSAPYKAAMLLRKNTVTVSAGDDVSGVTAVFTGTIIEAWTEANSQPDVALAITAFAGALEAAKPAPPTSYPKSADAATIMSGLAVQAGLSFESNNVSVQLSTPYFSGSLRDQMKACAAAANINWLLENNTLAIWPKGGSRGKGVVIVSPETGLVGYPGYNSTGVNVTTLFNPTIRFGMIARVQSSLKQACGDWFITALTHSLEAELPGGSWFTSFQGAFNPNAIPQ